MCRKYSLVFILLALIVFTSHPSFADIASLVPEAKKEKEILWYTTTSTPDNRVIVKKFERKYPFLKVKVLRSTGEKLRARILTEAAAGKYFYDLVAVNEMEMGLLKSRNLLLQYHPPEAKSYPAGSKDRDGTFTGIYARNFVIGYNTGLVSQKNVPRDWPDLLRPEWKGQIGLDEEEFEWYGSLIDYWGREKTRKFMKALSRQEPQLRRGHTLLAQLLGAGEFAIAIVYPYQVERIKSKGAPIDWVRTSDPIVTSLSVMAISAKSPHPNAAKLFINFILSEEGQTTIRDRYRVPIRPGITPASPKLEQSDLKIKYVPSDMFTKVEQYSKEFKEIFWKNR